MDWIQDQASFVHHQSEMRRCSQSRELSASSGTDSFFSFFSLYSDLEHIKLASRELSASSGTDSFFSFYSLYSDVEDIKLAS